VSVNQTSLNLLSVQAAADHYGCERTYIQWLLSEKHVTDAWTGDGRAPAHLPRVSPEELDKWWDDRGWHRSPKAANEGHDTHAKGSTAGGADDGADTLLNFSAQIDALLTTFAQERREASAALKAEIEAHRRTTEQRDNAARNLKFDRKQHKRELEAAEKRGAAEAKARALIHNRIAQEGSPTDIQDLPSTPRSS
jgi:DNA-binding protein H-NS